MNQRKSFLVGLIFLLVFAESCNSSVFSECLDVEARALGVDDSQGKIRISLINMCSVDLVTNKELLPWINLGVMRTSLIDVQDNVSIDIALPVVSYSSKEIVIRANSKLTGELKLSKWYPDLNSFLSKSDVIFHWSYRPVFSVVEKIIKGEWSHGAIVIKSKKNKKE